MNNTYIYMVCESLIRQRGYDPLAFESTDGQISLYAATAMAVYGATWEGLDKFWAVFPENDDDAELQAIWDEVWDEIELFLGESVSQWEDKEPTESQALWLLSQLIEFTFIRSQNANLRSDLGL